MKGDPNIARAILVLSAHEAPWETFVDGLRKLESDTLKSLVSAAPDEVFVFQGRARALADVLTAIQQARSLLDRIPPK